MSLGNLAKTMADRRAGESRLEKGEPLIVQARAVNGADGKTITGLLLVDAIGLKGGTEISIREFPGEFRGMSLSDAVADGKPRKPGDSPRPLSRPDDVIVFSSAYLDGGQAVVGPAACRVHDGLEGQVQVMTVMARPGRMRQSKKGYLQDVELADASKAKVISGADEMLTFAAQELSKPWPGGVPGLILRDADGETAEVFAEQGQGAQNMCRKLITDGLFDTAGYKVEAIPVWRLPTGREQVLRDLGDAPFSKAYSVNGRQGFRPSLVILADEEEWAFGGKTGRIRRVAAGVNPIWPADKSVEAARLPTNVRVMGGKPVGVRSLYSEEAMTKAAAARSARRPAETPKSDATSVSTQRPSLSAPSRPNGISSLSRLRGPGT